MSSASEKRQCPDRLKLWILVTLSVHLLIRLTEVGRYALRVAGMVLWAWLLSISIHVLRLSGCGYYVALGSCPRDFPPVRHRSGTQHQPNQPFVSSAPPARVLHHSLETKK